MGLSRGEEVGWVRGPWERGRGKAGGPEGGDLLYNKNRSSNLSRKGLWEPQRAFPSLSEEGCT